ncbi:unnamed protein product [Boreogadus saida]
MEEEMEGVEEIKEIMAWREMDEMEEMEEIDEINGIEEMEEINEINEIEGWGIYEMRRGGWMEEWLAVNLEFVGNGVVLAAAILSVMGKHT